MKVQNKQVAAVSPGHASSIEAKPAAAAEVVASTGWAAKTGSTSAKELSATEARTRVAADTFFKAFGSKDLETLEAAYAPNVQFKDDMFTLTKRDSVMKMWSGAPKFETFNAEILEVKGNEVTAKWTVDYTMFGNKVHNVIESKLTFDDQGRITSQHENWDEKKWMSQALPLIPKFLQPAAYLLMRPLLSWQMGG